MSPDGRNLDDFYLARPGSDDIQLDLLGDYKINVALYGDIQAYLRDKRPPVLAIWGKNDPFFLPPVQRPSSGTSRTPKYASSTAATSPWRPTPARLAWPCATSSASTCAEPDLGRTPHGAPCPHLLFEAERAPPLTEADHDPTPTQIIRGLYKSSPLATPLAPWA